MASLLSAAGTVTLALALAADPQSAGPITAMLPLNSLLVCALAWVLLGERLKLIHFAGILVAIAGPICMAIADTTSSSLDGIALGLLAAACFGMSNYLLKAARAHGAKSNTVVAMVVLTIGVCGVGGLVGLYCAGLGLRTLADSPKHVLYAAFSGLLWAVAKIFFLLALGEGLAGPVSAIVNVNGVWVLVLDLIILQVHLQPLKYVGMFLCIMGVTVLALATPPAASMPDPISPAARNLLAGQ